MFSSIGRSYPTNSWFLKYGWCITPDEDLAVYVYTTGTSDSHRLLESADARMNDNLKLDRVSYHTSSTTVQASQYTSQQYHISRWFERQDCNNGEDFLLQMDSTLPLPEDPYTRINESGDIVGLTYKPLTELGDVNSVRSPSAGAICSFFGTTRDNFEGMEWSHSEHKRVIKIKIG